MDSVASQVRLTQRKDIAPNNVGARQVMGILRGHFAPDAVDAKCQGVVRFANSKKTDRTLEIAVLVFDVPLKRLPVRAEFIISKK